MFVTRKILEDKLWNMLAEDLGQGDITTTLIVPPNSIAEAEIVAKEEGVVAGIEEARIMLEELGLNVETLVSDGDEIKTKSILARISGDTRTILSVERTLLNILSRMSGIATFTRRLIRRLREAGLKTKVACTRKVAPGLLYFDKKSVSIGGGSTHRFHLDDMILIKDNHIIVAGGVKEAIERVKREALFSKKIEVEVTRVEDVLVAAEAGVDIIMLDNFSPEQIEEATRLLKKEKAHQRILIEASGGITEENILLYASEDVDIVSLGQITGNAKTLDMSLEITQNNV